MTAGLLMPAQLAGETAADAHLLCPTLRPSSTATASPSCLSRLRPEPHRWIIIPQKRQACREYFVVSEAPTNAAKHSHACLCVIGVKLLALMAEGHSSTAIAQRMVLPASAVEKHIGNVIVKLGLPPGDTQHRRVLAVLAYLRA
jgi:hypothetical protein